MRPQGGRTETPEEFGP